MIHLKLIVVAESIVRDAETNNVSVFNILEELGSPVFPVLVPRLSMLFLLEREEGDSPEIDCVATMALNGEEIGRASMRGDFEDKPRNRLILVAEGIELRGPGILSVGLASRGQTMGTWDIFVRAIKPPIDEEAARQAAVMDEIRDQARARGSRRLH